MAIEAWRQYVRSDATWSEWPSGVQIAFTSVGRLILVVDTPVSDSDTGAGADASALSASLSGTDSGASSDAAALTASLSGSDDGSGGDDGTASAPTAIDDLDIAYSVDSEGDRQIGYYDVASGLEGDETIVFTVHILGDTDQMVVTELQNVEKVPRRRTALSHLGGRSEEGSITYPKPGV